jgi:acid phosphatase (class B)
MNKKIASIIAIISFILVSFACVGQEENTRWVTLKDIARSLENQPPMNVGFDVDDTVLFSSPGYYYGREKYSPGNKAYVTMEEFWNEMNNGLDQFSIPKECARKLIELHKKRGDSIYFITARTKTKTESVTELLMKTFNLENIHEVIFTGVKLGENLKIKAIKENKIRIFYGDADSDIDAALEAGIRAIRIMRAVNSTNKPLPQNGSFGEEVLKNSEY